MTSHLANNANILLLGGTGEARILCYQIAAEISGTLFYSQSRHFGTPPQLPKQVRYHVGGFRTPHLDSLGGLKNFMAEHHIQLLLDCTHPYASRISQTALQASQDMTLPLWHYQRPPWKNLSQHTRYHNLSTLWQAIPPYSRVFLTTGQQELSSLTVRQDIFLLWRGIRNNKSDFLKFQPGKTLLQKGPFSYQAEHHLLQHAQISLLVSKESGAVLPAKIQAARDLRIPLWTLRPPDPVFAHTSAQEQYNTYWVTNCVQDIYHKLKREIGSGI